MKSFLLTIALLAGFNVQASTMDGYTLSLIGAQSEESFSLNAVQTRTEYKTEVIEKTCFKPVFDGYYNDCRFETEQQCYEDGMSRRICRPVVVNRCRQEIRYRQQAYSCPQTVSIPYEVFSNNVKANVNVRVSGNVQSTQNSCGINFTLDGAQFKAVATCSDYIVLAKQAADERREGNTVIQTRNLDVTLVDARQVTAPVKGGVRELRFEGQSVVFKSGDLTKNPNFSLKLYIERRKLLGKDETIINRTLAPSEYSFEKTSEDSGIVKINLSKLVGGINDKKKHVIRVTLDVVTDTATAINSSLPSFSASDSITVNN
jgi:hypothetical protein